MASISGNTDGLVQKYLCVHFNWKIKSLVETLEPSTVGYARTNIIGSRTSFIIAPVHSSVQ
jgi:hypothetical protein